MLLLDEPTNHLDLESREALEAALEAFEGTVLLVSHDRALLDAVATRLLAVENGTVHGYDGGWADLVRRRAEQAEIEAAAARRPAEPRAAARPEKPMRPAPRRPTELERVEAEIAEREARIAALERSLAEDGTNVDLIAAHRREREELQALIERWEALFDQAQA